MENIKTEKRKNKPSAATVHARSRQTAHVSASSEEEVVEDSNPHSLQHKVSHSLLISLKGEDFFKKN